MTCHLHQIVPSLALSFILTPLPGQEDTAGKAADSDWANILEEAEASADWAADPLADLGLYGESSSSLLFISSLRAGKGYSSNYLKRPEAVGSRFYHIEADAWLSWFLKDSTVTGSVFAESNIYQNAGDRDNEYLTFAQFTWSKPEDDWEYGIEMVSLFADQIYDASLNPGATIPTSLRIRQFKPEALVYADLFPGNLDRLRAAVTTLRAEYNFVDQDYWEPGMALEWERLWKKSLRTLTTVRYTQQLYDDEFGREADGGKLPEEEPLVVERLILEERLTWKPQQWKSLNTTLTMGVSWDQDRIGFYKSMRQSWISARANVSGDWGRLRLAARWMEMHYDHRLVDPDKPDTVLHTQRSLEAEYKLPLPWSLAVYVRGEWARLNSRVEEDRYKEQRGEILFEWSY